MAHLPLHTRHHAPRTQVIREWGPPVLQCVCDDRLIVVPGRAIRLTCPYCAEEPA